MDVCEDCDVTELRKKAADTIWELAKGNKRYIARRDQGNAEDSAGKPMVCAHHPNRSATS